jgi:hypothetical protein
VYPTEFFCPSAHISPLFPWINSGWSFCRIILKTGEFVMGLLPAISMFLLGAVAIWFFWPLIVDPLSRAASPSRRDLRRDADRTADLLFDTWAERG